MMRYFLILFLLFTHNTFCQNEDAKTLPPNSLSTPKATVNTFLKNLQEEEFHPEIAAKTLNPEHIKGKNAELIITQLKQVLDGAGVLIDLDEIPENPNY